MGSDERIVEAGAVAPDLLLYDYFKHLTTLSLVALGGVLGLTEKVDPSPAKPVIVSFVAACIALSGVTALSAAANIAGISAGKKARGISPRINLRIAMLLLGMGAGGFVVIFLKSL